MKLRAENPARHFVRLKNHAKFLLYDNLVVDASQAIASSIIVERVDGPAVAASAQFKEKLESAPVANHLRGVKSKRYRISVAGIKFAIHVNPIDVDYVGSAVRAHRPTTTLNDNEADAGAPGGDWADAES